MIDKVVCAMEKAKDEDVVVGLPSEPPSPPINATQSQITASKDAAIANLLEIVAANNIEINDNLRRAILGEELYNEAECKATRRQTFSKRQSVLTALVQSHATDVEAEETDIAKEIRETIGRVKRKDASFEVRIKNGSYTVKSPVMQTGKKPGQQHIPTVTNSGAIYNCWQAMKRLLTSGKLKQESETKVIMDGVNLFLEEGKMYLVSVVFLYSSYIPYLVSRVHISTDMNT